MPLTKSLDPRGFLRLTAQGPWPTRNEQIELQDSLSRLDPRVPAHMRLLVDVRRITSGWPRYQDLQNSIDRLPDSEASRAGRRRALLVGSAVQYGIARMLQSLLPGAVEIFRDEDAAIDWLLRDDDRSSAGIRSEENSISG